MKLDVVIPSLIVAPASVLDQWMDQLGKWGHFSVMRAGEHVKKSDDIAVEMKTRRVEILVMSYEFMKLSINQLNLAGLYLLYLCIQKTYGSFP